jgi:nitroimidazol reductase NimA-like FMN-containing flavoprotein (pyridoxamine 5'-phosphate oxidase superfamily)
VDHSEESPALEHTTARTLNEAEINLFLTRPLIARMATIRGDRPHVVPVWFGWDGKFLWITLDRSSVKYRNLVNNSHCMVTIDESLGGLRFRAVIIEGTAELIEQPEDCVLRKVVEIYTRYLGKEGIQASTPQRMLQDGAHVVVKLAPEKIITWDDTGGVAPIG